MTSGDSATRSLSAKWPGQAGDASRLTPPMALSDEARSVLQPTHTVPEFLAALRRKTLWSQAIQVVAHWFDRPMGVLWVCACVRETMGATGQRCEDPALEAAERWARDPNEESRRVAGRAAESANYETASACAALAAFWSGGSMAPPGAPAVPAPPHLFPGALVSAIQLAAVAGRPDQVDSRMECFLDLAVTMAQQNELAPGMPGGQ